MLPAERLIVVCLASQTGDELVMLDTMETTTVSKLYWLSLTDFELKDSELVKRATALHVGWVRLPAAGSRTHVQLFRH